MLKNNVYVGTVALRCATHGVQGATEYNTNIEISDDSLSQLSAVSSNHVVRT
jgi:hypothetical protein